MQSRLSISAFKSCSVVGLGVSNLPLVRFLSGRGMRLVARDEKSEAELGEGAAQIRTVTGNVPVMGHGKLNRAEVAEKAAAL